MIYQHFPQCICNDLISFISTLLEDELFGKFTLKLFPSVIFLNVICYSFGYWQVCLINRLNARLSQQLFTEKCQLDGAFHLSICVCVCVCLCVCVYIYIYKLLKKSMEYHFLRKKLLRNNYFYYMFDILLERGINSLR